MTRLISDWIKDIPDTILEYDNRLKEEIGLNLRDLAFQSEDKSDSEIRKLLRSNKAAVVRFNTGDGIIDGFDDAIVSILTQLGIETMTCENENVAGIYEAMSGGANILFMADDDRYTAVNTRNDKIAENDYCTARGYATVLQNTEGSLIDKDVALLGYGRVGKQAAEILNRKGARVWVYEKKHIQKTPEDKFYDTIKNKEDISKFKLIFDATNEGSWMDSIHMVQDTSIVSPGLPLSFDLDKLDKSNILCHDMLHIGTAFMLAEIL